MKPGMRPGRGRLGGGLRVIFLVRRQGAGGRWGAVAGVRAAWPAALSAGADCGTAQFVRTSDRGKIRFSDVSYSGFPRIRGTKLSVTIKSYRRRYGVGTVSEIISSMRAIAPPGQRRLHDDVLAELRELTQALIAAKTSAPEEHARFLAIAERGLCLPEADACRPVARYDGPGDRWERVVSGRR